MLRRLFGGTDTETTKVSYGWWQKLGDCHKLRHSSEMSYTDFVNLLFNEGYQAVFAKGEAINRLDEVTSIFKSRTKSVTVRVSATQCDELDKLAVEKGWTQQDVVGHVIRVGYSIAC